LCGHELANNKVLQPKPKKKKKERKKPLQQKRGKEVRSSPQG
jgi:hypothetical protein